MQIFAKDVFIWNTSYKFISYLNEKKSISITFYCVIAADTALKSFKEKVNTVRIFILRDSILWADTARQPCIIYITHSIFSKVPHLSIILKPFYQKWLNPNSITFFIFFCSDYQNAYSNTIFRHKIYLRNKRIKGWIKRSLH